MHVFLLFLLNSPAFKFQLIDFLFLFAGLFFIESNLAASTGNKQVSPIGFDIIFPAMIEYAKNLDLNIPVGATNLDALFHKRELKLQRLRKSQDWEMVLKWSLAHCLICRSQQQLLLLTLKVLVVLVTFRALNKFGDAVICKVILVTEREGKAGEEDGGNSALVWTL
ncbi:hypothetical protein SO802_010994 [Lithocarpus litseifolius]|uniref:Uncharacterized protein n=1 Tax=Lithocarpus litseifolius TaxID=425828 RepID=A0AAW2DGA0_9ROSI